ncbi:mannose-1-phosphate guanylyltransferase [Marinobacterium sp. MBR-111]
MFTPVIMAGGSGSRLWPLSRQNTPKQFLDLDGSGHTLLQKTLLRLGPVQHDTPLIVSNESHRFQVAEQLRHESLFSRIILEPASRNTAPAVALAALSLVEQGDPVLLVLSADHHFERPEELLAALETGCVLAAEGHLVTFGISPQSPETGYGYICKGESLCDAVWHISSFAEKPDLVTATHYLSSGKHLWNSGMFMFKASVYLDELQKYEPEMLDQCRKSMAKAQVDPDFIRPNAEHFIACPENSIDYAVMERTDNAYVVELDAGWNDIGSWSALSDISPKDDHGNSAVGDVCLLDTQDSLVHAHHRYVAALGLEDCIVVETKDAILVAAKTHTQQVKDVVLRLKNENRREYSDHTHILRPWGEFDTIDTGHRYQVKRITVQPGEQLSLQMHYHRAEHWIVVSGTAHVVCGDKEQILTENQSTYIPVGVKHRLENPGKIPLEVIEVQSGHYLGEDDIVRFTDIYGRCTPARGAE